MRQGQGCNNGVRHRDVKVLLSHLRKERKTTNGIKGWSTGQRSYLRSGGTPSNNVRWNVYTESLPRNGYMRPIYLILPCNRKYSSLIN
jgi:hypothetical protein